MRGKDEGALSAKVPSVLDSHRNVTVAFEGDVPGTPIGIAPCSASSLPHLQGISHVIVEGDGAARRPPESPRGNEPVVPGSTPLTVVVVGVDALGGRLEEDDLFPSRIAADLPQAPLGSVAYSDTIAKLVTCPEDIAEGTLSMATIVPFVSKVDPEDSLRKGTRMAR